MNSKVIALVENIKFSAHDVVFVTYHHHFNNKLFALTGQIQLLQEQIESTDSQKEIVTAAAKMHSNAKNIKQVMDKINTEFDKRKRSSNIVEADFSKIDLKGNTFLTNLNTMHKYFDIKHGQSIRKATQELQKILKEFPEIKDEAINKRINKIKKSIDSLIAIHNDIDKADLSESLEPYPGNHFTLSLSNN